MNDPEPIWLDSKGVMRLEWHLSAFLHAIIYQNACFLVYTCRGIAQCASSLRINNVQNPGKHQYFYRTCRIIMHACINSIHEISQWWSARFAVSSTTFQTRNAYNLTYKLSIKQQYNIPVASASAAALIRWTNSMMMKAIATYDVWLSIYGSARLLTKRL